MNENELENEEVLAPAIQIDENGEEDVAELEILTSPSPTPVIEVNIDRSVDTWDTSIEDMMPITFLVAILVFVVVVVQIWKGGISNERID